jgi:hypothetical protein
MGQGFFASLMPKFAGGGMPVGGPLVGCLTAVTTCFLWPACIQACWGSEAQEILLGAEVRGTGTPHFDITTLHTCRRLRQKTPAVVCLALHVLRLLLTCPLSLLHLAEGRELLAGRVSAPGGADRGRAARSSGGPGDTPPPRTHHAGTDTGAKPLDVDFTIRSCVRVASI